MTDPRRPAQSDRGSHGPEPTDRLYRPYPLDDPAYAGQARYWPGPTHLSAPGPDLGGPNPTEQLPHYWQQGQPGEPPQQAGPPRRPHSPRWLWIAAGAALLLVVALVIALVITNGSAKNQTAVPPWPALSGTPSTAPLPTTTNPTTAAPTNTSPTESTSAAAMQTVVYTVTGEGRAISVTYADSGGVKQTEFNVALPWSKEVSLPSHDVASVTIINIGHDVTCSLTVNGVQVRQHTGVGLTICSAGG
ncbi:MmpS family transport accessory protein [Mycobacterium botniense]|uniref:Transport accessory protein MmpS3 n=1 Tax=Mycobacterium botniense TaxID=84962 RepID=A0A7I9XZW2_9MYCO|nr:MmpS family transport accessory protein [Mycobacterium botniense]GFG75267.1 hypothetical protein MBOT_26320 [Mycobacterium botniense]